MTRTSGLNEFLAYRDEVPEDVRNAIKASILESQMLGYDEFIYCTTTVLASLVGGEIAPSIAREARSYFELIMAAITAKHAVHGSPSTNEDTMSTVANRLRAAKKKATQVRQQVMLDEKLDGRFEATAVVETAGQKLKVTK